VPVGTSASGAERIMEEHGFKCERTVFPSGRPWAGPLLRCVRKNDSLNRMWVVDFFLQDERIVDSEYRIFTDLFRMASGS
jgi:hypothetical protein